MLFRQNEKEKKHNVKDKKQDLEEEKNENQNEQDEQLKCGEEEENRGDKHMKQKGSQESTNLLLQRKKLKKGRSMIETKDGNVNI